MQHVDLKFCAIAATVIFLFAVIAMRWFKPQKTRPQFKPKNMLTANEKEFFGRLTQALPDFYVFPQVAMGAILASNVADSKETFATRAKFSQKIVDFVICDGNLDIVALVELDDRTHVTSKDAERDAMTRQGGYVTIRYQSKNKPVPSQIRKDVLKLSN